MIVTHGNFFRWGDAAGPIPVSLTLTEGTETTGGQFTLCRFEDVGPLTIRGVDLGDFGGMFALDMPGGNAHGIYINGTKLDVSAYPSLWSVVNSGESTHYVWQKKEPIDKALEVLNGVSDGITPSFRDTLTEMFRLILTGSPTLTKAALIIDTDIYIVAQGHPFDAARLINNWLPQFFPAMTFAEIRDFIRTYDAATWRGESTQVVEEYG